MDRSKFSQPLTIAMLLVATIAVTGTATADDGTIKTPRWQKEQHGQGIWKAVTPPGHMSGQFASHDPIGLAAGALIKADCSINWVNPDTGKLFCFSSGTSLVYFLSWPKKNAARAREAWKKLSVPTN